MGGESVMPSSEMVERARLIGAIDAALERRMLVIVAPSGYGKSTLLRQWEQSRQANVIHLDCRQSDNIPARFVSRLIAAAAPTGLMVSSDVRVPSEALLELLDRIAATTDTITVVLDDIGIIVNEDVLDLISMLIDELPANARCISSGRVLPQIHLFRRVLDENLSLLVRADLAFTDEEAAGFLRQRGYDAGEATGDQIRVRADGWIAGLMLLALADRPSGGSCVELADLTVNASLDHYIEEELLRPLAPDVQSALLLSSELPFLSPSLWEHLFPSLAATETLAMLAAERSLLTVQPSEHDEQRYALHRLLSESLGRIARARIPRTQRDHIIGEAANWILAHGDVEQALDTAIRGERWDLAVPMMEDIGTGFADRDQARTILHWINRLPRPVIISSDRLAYWVIFASYCVGQVASANEMLSRVEPRWHRSQDPVVRGWLHACRGMQAAFSGDDARVARESSTALGYFPDHCHVERLHALTGLMDAAIDTGRFNDVARLLDRAHEARMLLPPDQTWWQIHVELIWPRVLAVSGQLSAAYQLYDERLSSLRGDLKRHDGKFASRMAMIALERNELALALRLTDHFDFVIEDRFAAIYWYPEAWLIRARILMALGQDVEAQAEIDRAIAFSTERGMFQVLTQAQTIQAVWACTPSLRQPRLEEGQSPPAASLVLGQQFGTIEPVFADILWQLRRHERRAALGLIERVIQAARARNRVDVELRAQVFAAIAHSMSDGERGLHRAARSLGRAIALGREGGFIRSFLVPTYDLRQVLERVQADPADLPYVARIRAAMDDAYGGATRERIYLSGREQEVLRMLEAGASNQQIAEALFISVNTVKKHLVRINRKLGTSNRTAAVLNAKQSGFLQQSSH